MLIKNVCSLGASKSYSISFLTGSMKVSNR